MGIFAKEEDKPSLPPNKVKRKECWEKRDLFFECLTANNIDNSLDPKQENKVKSECGALRTEFENKCVASWFKYFQEKRYSDLIRQRYIAKLESEGAQPLPFKLGSR
ncbi:cytochrome c oxidase assembly factor 6 [[Candida] anglica]|uniref:Cytochrome c oxidase assembly factor 6 n=1 Tax=[Candida] anglica TaxID=148631 RepID=A0ABP0EEN2_9ASCO